MTKSIQINLNNLFDTKGIGKSVDKMRFGVALSGGRDSIALAYAFKKEKLNFFAVNVEHGIRGEASKRDSKFVAEFCKKHEIELKSYSVDVPTFCKQNGASIEQGARILRYRIFESLIQDGQCDYIALAHHANDQAETVIMHILRGTGIKGLVGMREINGKYIRPFLKYTREDINAYIEQNELNFVEDETNTDTSYSRNFLRNELKVLQSRYPSIVDSILRLSRNAEEADDFIEKCVPSPCLNSKEAYINILDLKEPIIAKKLIMKAANGVGVYQDIEERHFPLILSLTNEENGKKLDLPHGLCVYKENGCLVFVQNGGMTNDIFTPNYAKDIDLKIENCDNQNDDILPFAQGIYVKQGFSVQHVNNIDNFLEKKLTYAAKDLYIDADKLPNDAIFRHRQNGDYICKFGGGKKSVGDFLTDKKVPLRKRNNIWVLAKESEVFCILGVEISRKVKVEKDSFNIYKISVLN